METDAVRPQRELESPVALTIEDDREHIRPGDRVLLIIEDDLAFVRIMLGMARAKGFKVVVAMRGDTGLALANELRPDAITLDIALPVCSGRVVLDRLKHDPRTRHIPVCIISITDRGQRELAAGAFSYLEKPVTQEAVEATLVRLSSFLDRPSRRVLLLERDPAERKELTELLGEGEDVEVSSVQSPADALHELDSGTYDCFVVDPALPDHDGVELIERVRAQPRFDDVPIVVYSSSELSPEDEQKIKQHVESLIDKGEPQAPSHLLRDTSLYLHRVFDQLPERAKQAVVSNGRATGVAGKKVLIVDDDARNIFALTSVLESHGIDVVYAENGRAGIEVLHREHDIDVVLMDVMMPEMDGYETMKAIRNDPDFKSLPIIAITAKALKDDRERCISAGASDYLPKPVDVDKLIDVVRLWSSR